MVLPSPVTSREGLSLDNPVGRVPHPDHHSIAELHGSARGWKLTGNHRRTRRGRWTELDASLELLNDIHEVRIDCPPDLGVDLSQWVRRAASRGTFVVGNPDQITGAHPGIFTAQPGDLAWDIAAITQRRAALIHTSERAGHPDLPSLSVLLVTRRPDFVPRIIRMLEKQTHPNFEVIVVHHGPDPISVTSSLPITGLGTSHEVTLGAALDVATSAASGDLVTKVDDDDFYGPDHLMDLALAHRYSGALLVGKSSTVVYLEELNTTVRRVFMAHEEFTHRVAGGTLLLASEDLASIGGWPDVPRGVDSHLIERVTRSGGLIYRPHDIGYMYVRHARTAGIAHTWDTDVRHFLRNSREQWFGMLRSLSFGTG